MMMKKNVKTKLCKECRKAWKWMMMKLYKKSVLYFETEPSNNLQLPVIKLQNNGKEFYFVVDSGCGTPIISPESIEELAHSYIPMTGSKSCGVEGNIRDLVYASVFFDIDGQKVPSIFGVIDIQSVLDNLSKYACKKISGFIGTSFLYAYKSKISYRRSCIISRWTLYRKFQIYRTRPKQSEGATAGTSK